MTMTMTMTMAMTVTVTVTMTVTMTVMMTVTMTMTVTITAMMTNLAGYDVAGFVGPRDVRLELPVLRRSNTFGRRPSLLQRLTALLTPMGTMEAMSNLAGYDVTPFAASSDLWLTFPPHRRSNTFDHRQYLRKQVRTITMTTTTTMAMTAMAAMTTAQMNLRHDIFLFLLRRLTFG